MDIISIILSRNGINRLKASGGVGYSDGGGSLKFNDDFDSTVYLEAFRRVTDKTYKVDAIKSITLRDTEEESTIAPQGFIDLKGDGSIYIESSEAIFIVYKQAEMEGGTVLPVGTYFTHIESAEVLSIEFTETIHPIDPKYIPGAVLPVVEISTDIAGTLVELNDSESARLDEVSALVSPINVVLSPAEGAIVSAPCFFMKGEEGMIFKSMISHDVSVNLVKQGGTWMGIYGSM